MTEVIITGFSRRERMRYFDLDMKPIANCTSDYKGWPCITDSDGWTDWTYVSGRSSGIAPMIFSTEKRAMIGVSKWRKVNEVVDWNILRVSYDKEWKSIVDQLGYQLFTCEIIPVTLTFSG